MLLALTPRNQWFQSAEQHRAYDVHLDSLLMFEALPLLGQRNTRLGRNCACLEQVSLWDKGRVKRPYGRGEGGEYTSRI